MPFVAILTANMALPWSSLAVTGYAFRYSGHACTLHQQQGPCSIFLVINGAKDSFTAILTAYKALS